MSTLVIPAETLSGSLSKCKDGEEGEFTVKGTLHIHDGAGVVTGEVSKKGYKADKDDEMESEMPDKKKMKHKMSPAASAVVKRKGGVSDY